jgi:hypothetical protein
MVKPLGVLTLALGVGIVAPAFVPIAAVFAQGQGGGPPEWTPAVRHDTSRPLREMPALPAVVTREDFEVKQPAPGPPVQQADPAVQQFAVSPIAALASTGFDGVGEGNPQFSYNVNAAPPDTVGEPGLNQYVQWVNSSFAVFDKSTGTRLYGPAGGNTLWSGFGGPCESRNDGDPIVQFDQLADRWVMTQFALQSGNYQQCVAVSATSDALGAWHRYAFLYSQFPDYPKLSVWPDAYYITFNMFGAGGGSFTGGRICGYDRAKMLSGLPATQVCVQNNAYASSLVADLDGKTLPPNGTAAYVMNRTTSGVNLWRFSVSFTAGTASITGPVSLPVSAYTAACNSSCVPQPSTSQRLDALGDRLMYRLSYRNLGSRASLVVNHSVVSGGVINIRWYEVDVTNAAPVVRQQSTYAPGDGSYRWMGSIAMDKIGNIAVGYSVSSGTVQPSIRFAGREVNDPLNTLSLEDSMQVGTGSQVQTLSRWGDYSTMAIDPVDDCTFWYTTEFLKTSGTFNWSTRISSFKFVTCGSTGGTPGFLLDVTPTSRTVTQGQSTTFDAGVTSQNGYGGNGSFSVTGLPANTTHSWSSAGYTGGSGASTLTINTTASTPTGSYPLTITATDSSGTPTQSTIVTLNVNAAQTADFTISASPANRTIKRGNSGTYNVTVTETGGFSGNVAFTVSGLPAGTTASFNPTSVNGSGTSTMTVFTTNPTTPKGTFTLTITGTSSSLTRSTTVNLKVQ